MNYTRNRQQQVDDTMADKDAEISMMVSMGFTAEQAAEALNATNGNIDQAIDYLLSGDKKQDTSLSTVKRKESKMPPDTFRGSRRDYSMRKSNDDEEKQRKSAHETQYKGTNKDRHSMTFSPTNTSDQGGTENRAPKFDKKAPKENRPGAVAMEGMNPTAGQDDDDFTITGGQSMLPISARVVQENEEDYEHFQDRLCQQEERLQKVIAGLENAAVAQVLTNDEEAQHAEHAQQYLPSGTESSSKEPIPAADQSMSSPCGPRTKWIVVVAVVLLLVVIVAVALGVALGGENKDDPSQDCADDTDALYATTKLSTAVAWWRAELIQNAESFCAVAGECNYDSKMLSTHSDLVFACEQVGGVSYFLSFSTYCTYWDNGREYESTYNYIDIPDCVATTCSMGQANERLQDHEDELDINAEAGISSLGYTNVECS